MADAAQTLSSPFIHAFLRLRDLVRTPDEAFAALREEKLGAEDVFLRWVLPWSAFFMLCGQLGAIAFPTAVRGVSTAPSMPQALWTIVLGTAAMAGGVYVLAWATEALARRFGGRSDPQAALKLVAYSATALWAAGVFGLAPFAWPLSLAGLYAIRLYWQGLPILLDVPKERAGALTAAVVSAAALLAFLGVVLAGWLDFARAAAPGAWSPPAAERLDPAQPIPDAVLAAALPDALPGGWLRTEIAMNNGGALGFTGRTAAGRYVRDGQSLVVSLVDLGPDGEERGALARALHPPSERGSGHVRLEPWNGDALEILDAETARAARAETFGPRIAAIAEAEGGVDPAELRALFGALPRARLARTGAPV